MKYKTLSVLIGLSFANEASFGVKVDDETSGVIARSSLQSDTDADDKSEATHLLRGNSREHNNEINAASPASRRPIPQRSAPAHRVIYDPYPSHETGCTGRDCCGGCSACLFCVGGIAGTAYLCTHGTVGCIGALPCIFGAICWQTILCATRMGNGNL